ncbi:hypothetical protein [Oleidesulfovibrio sp.]|uniref:hypothetical protein n=1 Tax=Oleidesulfovibrio sp. TaxID=2909707 RepID=UPI003A847AE8
MTEDRYSALRKVLEDACNQASDGKGKERHADNNRFEDQPIMQITRLVGDHPVGALAYQVIKKTVESGRLYKLRGINAARAELLGAINYLAATVIRLENIEAGKSVPGSGSEEEDREIAAAACAISCPHGASEVCTQPCEGSGVCPLRPGEMIPLKEGKDGLNLLKFILERQKNHITTDYEQEIAREYASLRGWQLGVTPFRVWF